MTIQSTAERAIVCDRVQALADRTRCRSMTTEEQVSFDADIAALSAFDRAPSPAGTEGALRSANLPAQPHRRRVTVGAIFNEEQRATACLMAENRMQRASDPKRWPGAQDEAEAYLNAIAAYDQRHPRPNPVNARKEERDLDRSIAASQISALRAFAAKR